MTTRNVGRLSGAIELATGIAVIGDPGLVVRLIFGVRLSGGGSALGRLAGFGLLSLGLACWSRGHDITLQAIRSLFIYNLLVGLYLAYLGVSGGFTGYLLWPGCLLHVLLALLMARPAYKDLARRIP